jgi:hypothetical protein
MFHGKRDLTTRDGAFNHSTSDFPYILANVMNKSLQQGYEEARTTYQIWTRSVPANDFKTMSVTQLSEAPNLSVVNENGEVTEGTLSEKREQYSIATYAKILSITRQTLINDDMGAFTRIPMMFGAAARRVPNRLVYNILQNNAAMADSYNLFSTDHSNIVTAGAVPSVATINALRLLIRKQVGMQAADSGEDNKQNVLNLDARFIIAPPDQETTIDQILNATFYPATAAIVPTSTMRSLIPVIDGELSEGDNANTAGWYLACSIDQIDTIEVAFLDGVDAPMFVEQAGFDVMGMRFRAHLDCGAKAIDFRGMAYNDGVT